MAFDADAAGQGAAERFYEWEQKHKVDVLVARLPEGKDPGDLASSDPDVLVEAVAKPVPFLKFRLDRTMRGRGKESPEQRVRLAEDAMAVINEHPNQAIRMLYAGEMAADVGMPINDMVRLAERGTRRPAIKLDRRRTPRAMENAEFAALVLLVQEWDSIASWLVEALFDDDANRLAFVALADADGDLQRALESVPPEAREVLERAAVADLALDADVEAKMLIGAAVRRELRQRSSVTDPQEIERDRLARLDLEALNDIDATRALHAAESLLGWLHRRTQERSGGD